ncbi:MAG: DUF4157 domain-containing protein [Kofleriaceae bacterium]
MANIPAAKLAERREALAQLLDTAAPLLQRAPKPSRDATREGIAGSWDGWDHELALWRMARVAGKDAAISNPNGARRAQHRPQSSGVAVQRKVDGGAARPANARNIAMTGVAAASATLPFGERIQRAFGRHDVSNVRVQIGGAAESATFALGARAYASGDKIAFGAAPDLHTAAHEAAHVIQQRAGVELDDDLGRADDEYERAADEVADAVVAGRSAETLLDRHARGTAAARGMVVQRKQLSKAKFAKTVVAYQYLREHTDRFVDAIAKRLAGAELCRFD